MEKRFYPQLRLACYTLPYAIAIPTPTHSVFVLHQDDSFQIRNACGTSRILNFFIFQERDSWRGWRTICRLRINQPNCFKYIIYYSRNARIHQLDNLFYSVPLLCFILLCIKVRNTIILNILVYKFLKKRQLVFLQFLLDVIIIQYFSLLLLIFISYVIIRTDNLFFITI